MQEIWTNSLLPKALKSCPKANKSPNLVTLVTCFLLNMFIDFVPMKPSLIFRVTSCHSFCNQIVDASICGQSYKADYDRKLRC